MRQVYLIVGLVLGLAIAAFALQNTAGVEVTFLLWRVEGPLAAVVLTSTGAGVLIALLFGLPELFSARWRIRSLERRLAEEEGRAASRPPPAQGGGEGPPWGEPAEPGRPPADPSGLPG